MTRCGYPNENWGNYLEKEEWRLRRGEPQYLLQGRRKMMTHRCLACMIMSRDAIHWVREYKTLSRFWGGIWRVHFGYAEFEMALNLGGEVEWAVIHMNLVLWRQIWTAEDIIGVYHHIDGNWNSGSRWDQPGRECTAEKEGPIIASRYLHALPAYVLSAGNISTSRVGRKSMKMRWN